MTQLEQYLKNATRGLWGRRKLKILKPSQIKIR